MKQEHLHEDKFERISSKDGLRTGFRLVKRNKGAPGIDGVSVRQFEEKLEEELEILHKELTEWSYRPSAVKRVEIPKPGGKKVRKLGIPTVRDRVVQASMKLVLEELFEEGFSDNSYGFRPKRSQKTALEAAQKIVRSGKRWVVDLDLENFFDEIIHDRVIHLIRKKLPDKRVLKLIGMTLRSKVICNGKKEPRRFGIGVVQGSPLSPLLSNIVLDELDKELEEQELSFCRFADDANIYVESEGRAKEVLASVTSFIERRLKLKVNREKSKTDFVKKVKFLGMAIMVNGALLISKPAMAQAYATVKELTPRGCNLPVVKQLETVNKWFQGWANYYSMTAKPKQIRYIEAHIRRRIRARLIRDLKRRKYVVRRLVKLGAGNKKAVARAIYSNKGPWALSITSVAHRAWSNKWFQKNGLKAFS